MYDNQPPLATDTMERPAKRQRLSLPPDTPEEEKATEEWDLQTARAQNDMRLKSIFEGIFSKYGKDFTEIGDEIDLETGNIVVDNGHLSSMHEGDNGDEGAQRWLYENDLSQEGDTDGDEIDEGQESSRGSYSQGEPLGTSGADPEPAKPSWSATTHHQHHHHQSGDDIVNNSVLQSSQAPDPFKNDRPTDPVWQAPELPTLFSTPTAETRRKGVPKLPHLEREASPPGSGSLWSVPRRGRPRTEVKPKSTPSKSRLRAKRKYHSSPVAHDWSFAATPDGDESDDPLQEFQPSPSISKHVAKNIRGKHLQPASRTARLCAPDAQLPPRQSQSDQSATAAEQNNKLQGHAKQDLENHVAFDASDLPYDSYAHSHSHVFSTTPSGTPVNKSNRGLTPDDAKLIVRMRHVQKRKWNQIHACLPHRTRPQIYQWNLFHWTERRTNPPPLSASWTQSELETLECLKEEPGLTWLDITSKMPTRTKAEIEFELLRLWVGDEVWHSHVGRAHDQESVKRQEANKDAQAVDYREQIVASIERYTPASFETFSREASEADAILADKGPMVFDLLDDDDDTSDNIRKSPSPSRLSVSSIESNPGAGLFSRRAFDADPAIESKGPIVFEDLLDDDYDDDNIDNMSHVSSPSKLSAIYFDSPAASRQGSRTPTRASPIKRLDFKRLP
ncbi:hypothetical protein N7454_005523 [Penicillium verhagenii]|nr:hypothetical protein N7454_005523 [Penicillium verhagenii]